MPKGEAGLFIEYCAKDFLDGTQLLGPWEELAYRRICDMIYASNNNLKDDDKMLAWATKTGRRWPAIKRVLTGGEHPKLLVEDGKMVQKRCSNALATAARKMGRTSAATAASVASGKSLKNLKRPRAYVRDDAPNVEPNVAPNVASNVAPNQPLNHLTNKNLSQPTLGVSVPRAREASAGWLANLEIFEDWILEAQTLRQEAGLPEVDLQREAREAKKWWKDNPPNDPHAAWIGWAMNARIERINKENHPLYSVTPIGPPPKPEDVWPDLKQVKEK